MVNPQGRALGPERPLLVSRRRAAEMLGIGLTTLKAVVARGELRELRIGRRRLVPRAEIEAYVSRYGAPETRS